VTATTVARVVGVLAAILLVTTGALGSGFSVISIPFMAWWLLPYAALLIVAKVLPLPWLVGGAGVAALTVETGIRASVFLFPRGSTDAIALVFSPVLIAFAMVVGALAGWGFGYLFRRVGTVGRVASVSAVVVVIGLIFIGLARPELFPTTVVARQRHLAAIGEPRIVLGGDRFARSVVSETSAWHLAGEFDDQPGEDLAIVDHKGAQLFDAVDLQPTRFIAFGGEPGRLWNWYSQLARVGDSLVVVQTGGGFQETQVMSLNNDLLWRFHPDAKLPPTALLPGDLDEDGETEFYASTTNAVTRLNGNGHQVWSQPSTLPHLIQLVPSHANAPPWVVSMRHGAAVDVWFPEGKRLAEVKWPGAVHAIVHWPDARRLIVGDVSVKGLDLDGRTQFEVPIEEPMRLHQAKAWTPVAGAPGLLAVVTGGDRDLKRWRLRAYQSPETVAYDEVFDQPPRLLVANHVDGTSTLFVAVGSTLTALTAQRN
jgi:hypothetical protein